MSSRSRLKKQFLAEHPLCCFCGGAAAAVEPDHIPSRVFFDNRQWPEGFVFPACVECNRASRHDEQVVAMLARIYPDATTEEGKQEVEERIRAVGHNYPEVLEEMRPTIRQKRNAIRRYGWQLPPGMSTTELPVLSVNGPLVNGAVENFGRKLFCALFYKHANQILPIEGGIAIKWFSNVQIENDEIPRSIGELLSGWPELVRCRTSLENQFFYRYVVAGDTKSLAVFLVFFRQSFAMLGYLNVNARDFKLPEGTRIINPFRHNS